MITSKTQKKKKITTEGLPQDSITAINTALIGGMVLSVTCATRNVHAEESWNTQMRKRLENVEDAAGMRYENAHY